MMHEAEDPYNYAGLHGYAILDERHEVVPLARYAAQHHLTFKQAMRVWGELHGDFSRKQVKRTELPGGVLISTVFLGYDHSFGEGPELWFETMIFPTQDCRRYNSWEHAEIGHEEMLKEYQETQKQKAARKMRWNGEKQ
jgi:hypothetical protein